VIEKFRVGTNLGISMKIVNKETHRLGQKGNHLRNVQQKLSCHSWGLTSNSFLVAIQTNGAKEWE